MFYQGRVKTSAEASFFHGCTVMLYSLGHYRAYGLALLVGFALPALADFGASDSANLQYIRDHFENPLLMHVQSIATWAKLARDEAYDCKIELQKLTDSEFMDTIRSGESASVTSALFFTNYFNKALVPIKDNHSSVTGLAVRVTSAPIEGSLSASTNLLEKIRQLSGMPVIPTDFSDFSTAALSEGDMNFVWQDYYYLWQALRDNPDPRSEVYSHMWNLYNKYGSWRWNAFDTFYKLNLDILQGSRRDTNFLVRAVNSWDLNGSNWSSKRKVYSASYYDQYAVRPLREALLSSGALSQDVFTNLFTSSGYAGTNSTDHTGYMATNSVFGNFAKSFLPSALITPDDVQTNLFEYVESGLSTTPVFSPDPLNGSRSRSSSSSADTPDFSDPDNRFQYNLVRPFTEATDRVQNDTENDDRFHTLSGFVSEQINDVFNDMLENISSSTARWKVKFSDDDEEYIDDMSSHTSDGISFICWCIESTMFLSFFFVCVHRALRSSSGTASYS